MERASAQARLNQSAIILVLLLGLAIGEFVLVSFVAPAYPGANPLATPTLDLLATPTATLPAEISETQGTGGAPTTTEEPTPDSGSQRWMYSGSDPDQLAA